VVWYLPTHVVGPDWTDPQGHFKGKAEWAKHPGGTSHLGYLLEKGRHNTPRRLCTPL